MRPGMVFTVGRRSGRDSAGPRALRSARRCVAARGRAEPILNQGTDRAVMWPDGWTYVTADAGRSAQFEHMVLITRTGHEVLTT